MGVIFRSAFTETVRAALPVLGILEKTNVAPLKRLA
jgi:hypothetical protein